MIAITCDDLSRQHHLYPFAQSSQKYELLVRARGICRLPTLSACRLEQSNLTVVGMDDVLFLQATQRPV